MTRRQQFDALGILLPVAIMFSYFFSSGELLLLVDSDSYLDFSEGILSGDLFEKKELAEIDFGRAVRTPGYPVMLAAGKLIFGDYPVSALVLHGLIAALTLAFLALTLRPYLSTVITGMCILTAELLMHDFFYTVMTEWLTFHLILILFAMLIISIRKPSVRNIFLTGLLITFMVLVRPAMLPAYGVLPLLMLYGKELKIRSIVIVATSMLPLLLWMGFNQYHLGRFTIAALDGHSWIGVGALLGHAEAEPGDSPQLQYFITEFNKRKLPAVGEADGFVEAQDLVSMMFRFGHNLWAAARPVVEEMGMDPVTYDSEIYAVYGKRIIYAHPERYVAFVMQGMKIALSHISPFLIFGLLLIPAACIWRQKCLPVAYAAIALFFFHIVHELLVCMVQGVFARYVVITLYPYMLAVVLSGLSLVVTEVISAKPPESLPRWFRVLLPEVGHTAT